MQDWHGEWPSNPNATKPPGVAASKATVRANAVDPRLEHSRRLYANRVTADPTAADKP